MSCSNVRVTEAASWTGARLAARTGCSTRWGKAMLRGGRRACGDLLERGGPDRGRAAPAATAEWSLGVDGCRAGWVGVVLTAAPRPPSSCATIGDAGDRGPARPPGPRRRRDRHPDRAARRRAAARRPAGPDHGCRSGASRRCSRPRPGGRRARRPTPRPARPTAPRRGSASASRRSAWSRRSSRSTRSSVARSCRIVEVHPEVSFAGMDPAAVVPSKGRRRGTQRARTRSRPPASSRRRTCRGQGYAADDLLDACAVAWRGPSRRHRGPPSRSPIPPEMFSDGMPAAIWV